MELEAEGNVLRVERQQNLDPVEARTHAVGDAGGMEFRLEGGGLGLVDARPYEGRDMRV